MTVDTIVTVLTFVIVFVDTRWQPAGHLAGFLTVGLPVVVDAVLALGGTAALCCCAAEVVMLVELCTARAVPPFTPRAHGRRSTLGLTVEIGLQPGRPANGPSMFSTI